MPPARHYRSSVGDWLLLLFVLFLLTPLGVLIRDALRTAIRGNRFRREREADLANSQNADARYQLALLYYEGGRPGKAEGYIAEAIRLTGSNPAYDGIPYRYLRLQGDILSARGRTEEAVATYRLALERPSELGHEDIHFGLGRTHRRLGLNEEALGWFQKANRDNGSRLETYFRIAQLCGQLGRAGEERAAIDEFGVAVGQLPRDTRERRLWWRFCFALYPLTRHLL